MYPRSGTYNTYPQTNFRYGENVAYSRPNYGVTSPTMPYVAGASINYGENVNYHRTNYGITAPTAPNIGNTPVFFGEATNLFRPNYGVVPPAAPNVGGASVVFGEATNANRPTFGITAPVLPAPRTQVNVVPVVPDIPVPQYNVPDRPIYYPKPTTFNAGDYPLPSVNNNAITYAPNTYPQLMNTSALQPLPAGGSEQFNPYAASIPAEQNIPSMGIPSSSPTREIDGLLGDTNAMIAQGNQVEQFTQQYAAQEEQIRQQQALQRQQQAVPPDLTQQYYQQSQAISNTYQQGQQQPQSSSSNVDGSSLPAAAKKGISQYGDIIKREASKNGIPASLLAGLILQESVFNPTAGSGAGAKGLTQLMPGTAKELGVSDVNNPEQSIAGGAKYLGQMFRKYNGNTTLALAAYNAGPGAVDKAGKNVPPYKETQHYVQVVQENEAKFRSAGFA
jgi:soluble lytic murein transglycosylase-like protein